jgi:glutathione S-transferase
MSLVVYGVPLSPFVRKLRLCLAEKALNYDLKIVMPFNQPEWFLEMNPLGRIPVLKDGDFVLSDSSVICHYLEDRNPASLNLLGRNVEQKAQVRWLEKYADYELAALTTFTVFRNRVLNPSMGKACDEADVKSAMEEKLPKHFDYLQSTLGDNDFLVGNAISLADIAFAAQMASMEHGGEVLDAERWPQLAALYERVKSRPSMEDMFAAEQKLLASMAG